MFAVVLRLLLYQEKVTENLRKPVFTKTDIHMYTLVYSLKQFFRKLFIFKFPNFFH